MEMNSPGPDEPLFAHTFKPRSKGVTPYHRFMTKKIFLERVQRAAKHAKLTLCLGHGIRIGATLEYLLRGVPFAAVRVIGCWASDQSFSRYLRKHTQILAPYVQAIPELHQQISTISLEDLGTDEDDEISTAW